MAGCSPAARQTKHLERAEKHFKAKRYREAAVEYLNVLHKNPTNLAALRGMGLAAYETGEMRTALPCLLRAEMLDPGGVDVKLKLGVIDLAMGEKAKAVARAEDVLKQQPENLDALILHGAGVSGAKDVELAIGRLLPLAGKFGDKPGFHLALASLYLKAGDTGAAEEVYRNALAQMPKAWELHLARADLYASQRDLTRAEQSYKEAADCAPPKSIARVRMAAFLWASGRRGEAKVLLDGLLKQESAFGAAVMARVEMAFQERDYAVAASLLQGLLKAEPSNVEAFLALQRINAAQGKVDEAIAGYEKVVSAFPKAAQGRYLMALALLQKGDGQKALGECARALELDPDHRDAVFLLAQLHVRLGQPESALALLKPYLSRHPGDEQASILIGLAYVAKKDYSSAANTYREMIKRMPSSPRGPCLLGLVLEKMGREAEAETQFEEALRLDPQYLDALQPLAGLLSARGRNWSDGARRIEQQLARVPDSPGIHHLLASYYTLMKEWDKAEKAFKRVIELRPDSTVAYMGLSHIYEATQRDDKALAKLDGVLAVNSNDVAALMVKGLILTKKGRPADAAENYRRILAVRPDFVAALNNLACLYLEDPKRLDQAYELAKRARTLAARDPRIADTLGWVLYCRGEYKWAMSLFQEALESMSGEPELLYHAGMCQAALGNDKEAQATLSKALAASGMFPGAGKAKAMLDVLSSGEKLQEQSSKEQVEAFLARHPENPFAMIKGGAYYEAKGDVVRARELYEKSIARNALFFPGLIRLAKLWAGPLEDVGKAHEMVKQAREAAPGNSEVMDAAAAIAFRKGDYRWAQSLLMESVSKGGETPQRQCLLGMAKYAMGKIDEATNLIDRALGASSGFAGAEEAKRFLERVRKPDAAVGRNVPAPESATIGVDDLPLRMHEADASARKGNKPSARSMYERIVGQYPDFSPAYRGMAMLIADQQSFSDIEFKALSKARELMPSDPDVGRVLGQAAFSRGQYSWAAQLLQESSAAFPDNATVFYYLGMCHRQLKDGGAAKKALRRGLELDPASSLAPRAREYLNSL